MFFVEYQTLISTKRPVSYSGDYIRLNKILHILVNLQVIKRCTCLTMAGHVRHERHKKYFTFQNKNT